MSHHSALFQFLAACIPYPELFSVAMIYGMVDSLLSVKESGVRTLEKLSVQNLVKLAIANPRKADELREVLNSNLPFPFSPLVFGDCPEISEFILNSTPIGPIPGLRDQSVVLVCMEPGSTAMGLSGSHYFDVDHPKSESSMEKIIELLFVIFRKLPENVTVMISRDFPEAETMAETIIDLSDDKRCTLKDCEADLDDEHIHVRFFNAAE